MSNKVETEVGGRFDSLLWLMVVAIVLAGVYANTIFVELNVLVRALGGIGVVVVALGVAMQTQNGSATWELAKEARVEIRKVIWPTREETTQTTMIVVGVVILVALMLWALDSVLSWAIKSLIG
ncbi:MAG: preprotein translocase subunit SecE [Pseudomonadales bacterium]|nr:preprotein translocase subunit SecE [Pseudomonadales bacterium]